MSRQTQPYRKGARAPSAALTAMLRGTTSAGFNPADVKRSAFLIAAGKHRRARPAGRPARPARAPRPERPPR